jgi:hypothetical protein
VSGKREPQPATSPSAVSSGLNGSAESNTEQGIMNVEGKENFIIRNSFFDIRYSNWEKLIGARILVSSRWHLSADT